MHRTSTDICALICLGRQQADFGSDYTLCIFLSPPITGGLMLNDNQIHIDWSVSENIGFPLHQFEVPWCLGVGGEGSLSCDFIWMTHMAEFTQMASHWSQPSFEGNGGQLALFQGSKWRFGDILREDPGLRSWAVTAWYGSSIGKLNLAWVGIWSFSLLPHTAYNSTSQSCVRKRYTWLDSCAIRPLNFTK